MTEITVCDGRVSIIKLTELSNENENLEVLKNTLLDFTTSTRFHESDIDTFLFVDLSPFHSISSSLIGIFGSIIMNPKIQLLGLCNAQSEVLEILKRFGVITDDGSPLSFASEKIKRNIRKVIAFHSVEDGLISLNPT
jgi:hypothetical protein